jgi:hypothetical protein
VEDNRFDPIIKALDPLTTRRLTLGVLIGGALGRLGLADSEARGSSGKCKPKCNECEKCDKGSCKRKNGERHCHKGKCKPKAAGTPCAAFPGGACQNGTCVNLKADETNCGSLGKACRPTQVCEAGSCFPRSTCPANPTAYCRILFATPCGLGCSCGQSTEGNVVCVSYAGAFCPPPDGTATPCTTSATCPPGSACMDTSVCGCAADSKVCVAQCPAPDA